MEAQGEICLITISNTFCCTICQQNQLKGIENASPAELGDIWKSSETSILSRVMRKGVK